MKYVLNVFNGLVEKILEIVVSTLVQIDKKLMYYARIMRELSTFDTIIDVLCNTLHLNYKNNIKLRKKKSRESLSIPPKINNEFSYVIM